mmetsp:Transcript_24480/g.26768  ORF Transcript_24480/g.26768 Transcript_24480/m.26768 type:complete len:301 (-) Transcript_24480:13-915(-)
MSKSISKVREALPRIHGLVIGPGLGRHENVLRTVEGIIEEVKSKNLHVVVDADGLFLLNRNPSLFRDYSRCIITPNKMEFDRLSEAVRNQLRNHEVASPTIETILQELSVENEAVKTRALSLALGGVTVYRKGEVDLITSGNDVYAITERGSPRRCGGQGDILAGTLATAYYWAFKAEPQNLLNLSTQLTNNTKIESFESRVDLDDIAQIFPEVQANERAILSKSLATAGGAQRLAPSISSFPSSASRDRIGAILASLLAGNIVKQASSLAFNKFGRSMTAPNVIGDLGNAFNTFVDDKA